MAHKEAYSLKELAVLLGISQQAMQKRVRSSWQSRPRKGRGGGKEWLVSSMPEATQRAIQTAEERLAIEEEAAHSAALPAATASLLPSISDSSSSSPSFSS